MPEYGTLLLLRHGLSTANADGLFTGLLDVPLSEVGVIEAHLAASLLNAADLSPDLVLTSVLARTKQTAEFVMADLRTPPREVVSDWRLDERNYGALTGRSKRDVLQEYGQAQFMNWRRSVDTPPPPMSDALYEKLSASALFRSLPSAALTRTESLRDVIARVGNCYVDRLMPPLRKGQTILVIAHGNSLRALCAILDELDDEAIRDLNIPTAQPLVYQFNRDLRSTVIGGRYLDNASAQAAAVALTNEGGT